MNFGTLSDYSFFDNQLLYGLTLKSLDFRLTN